MKILLVSSFLPHESAHEGGATVIWEELRFLAQRHDITVLAFIPVGVDSGEKIADLSALGIRVETVFRDDRGGIRAIPRRLGLVLRWLLGRDPLRMIAFSKSTFQRNINTLLEAENFDIVQIEDSAMAQYRYDSSVPSLLIEHELREPGGSEGNRWRRFQIAIWKKFDRIHVFTERDARGMEILVPGISHNLRVNPFGMEVSAAENAAAIVPGEVVFVGGFRHEPNIDAANWLCATIFPQVEREIPGVHLTIVGADPPRSIRSLARKGIEVTGNVDSVRPFLERAAVVVAPVRTGGGMRVKVLQAMAMGKAVVTTRLGAEGLSIDWEDPPLLISNEAAQFARDIVKLLSDDQQRELIGVAARTYVAEKHQWSRYVKVLESSYMDLAANCGEVS